MFFKIKKILMFLRGLVTRTISIGNMCLFSVLVFIDGCLDLDDGYLIQDEKILYLSFKTDLIFV